MNAPPPSRRGNPGLRPSPLLASHRLPAAKNPSACTLPVRPRDAFRKPPERRNGLVSVRRLRREPQEAQACRPLPLMLRLQGDAPSLSLSRLYFPPRGFSLLIGILTCDCATVWFGFVQLSCIDCGAVFGQGTVQTHTQCISEAVSSIASLPVMKFTFLL